MDRFPPVFFHLEVCDIPRAGHGDHQGLGGVYYGDVSGNALTGFVYGVRQRFHADRDPHEGVEFAGQL